MTIDPAVLERIRKLQAKADSLKAMGPEYEQEALTFAAAVQTMLLKHDLDLSDLEYARDIEADPVKIHEVNLGKYALPDKQREIMWEQALAREVAKAHQCEIIPVEKSNRFWLIGRRQHREVAEYMFVFLYRTVISLADKAYVKRFYELRDQGRVKDARGYRGSFIEGCVSRIIMRYREAREQQVAGLDQHQRGVAMIRLSTEKQLIKQTLQDLRNTGFIHQAKGTPLGNNKYNHDGYKDGDEAGRKVSLTKEAGLSGQEQQPALGKGQRLLNRGS